MRKTIITSFLFLLPALAGAATLSVSPSTQSVTVGDTFSVIVNLDTQGASVDGVDLRYLNYNPNLLQIQDANPSSSGVQIAAGNLMPMTLVNSVDSNTGRITFSQVAAGGNKYRGSGILATVSFKALATGNAALTFDYTTNKTTDSNVASGGLDVLSSVINGSFTINNQSGGSSSSGSTGSGSSSGSGSSGSSGGGSSSGGGGSSSGGTGANPVLPCAPGASAVSLARNLSRGAQGADVVSLQNFLISKGYLVAGNNTGLFGPMTESAVQSFQRAQNLISSGSPASTGYGAVGPKTKVTINSLSGSCTAGGTTTQSLQDQIKALQAMVNQLLLKLQSMKR